MRILVCGGRDFTDRAQLYRTLDFYNPSWIISGAARGADTLAADYAKVRKLPLEEYPAEWDKHGKSAGFIRNKEMLDLGKPDKIIAFAGGAGTANMIKQSKKAGVMTIEVPARPKCYILVGLPGSGKSHFADNEIDVCATAFSTDDIVDDICIEYGCTYDQGWSKLIDFATMAYNRHIDNFIKSKWYGVEHVVFDRTNLTKKSRKAIIDRFKKDYEIIVKTFEVPDDVRIARCAQRVGKSIPEDAIEEMKKRYEPFTEDEV